MAVFIGTSIYKGGYDYGVENRVALIDHLKAEPYVIEYVRERIPVEHMNVIIGRNYLQNCIQLILENAKAVCTVVIVIF